MRKLRRRLLACLTILSLLLCGATVGLWVRSYWREDLLAWANAPIRLVALGNSGELFFVYNANLDATYPWPGWIRSSSRAADNKRGEGWAALIGFGYFPEEGEHPVRAICFPHWFLALLFGILPAIRLRSILRNRRRFGAGLCPACGYDLRATPDRCPECGREVRT